jgi:hypothetical protein
MKNFVIVLSIAAAIGMAGTAVAQDVNIITRLADVFISSGSLPHRLVLSSPTTNRGMNRWAYLNFAVNKTTVYNYDDSVKTVGVSTTVVDSTSSGRKADYVLRSVSSPASGTEGTVRAGSKLQHIMTVYMWKDLKGIIVGYRLKNTDTAPITGKVSFELYPRIDQSYTGHSLRWRSQDSIAYYFRGTLAHFLGAKYVSIKPSGTRLSTGRTFYTNIAQLFAETQPDSVRFNAANYAAFDAAVDSAATTLRSMIHINSAAITINPNDSSLVYYYALAYDITDAGMVQAIKDVEARGRARQILTAVAQRETQVPRGFVLHQNFPNPFNPSTDIRFELAKAGLVNLTLYDAAGREVRTLVNGTFAAGAHTANFDASGLTSGVYFYTLRADNYTATRKMLLMR